MHSAPAGGAESAAVLDFVEKGEVAKESFVELGADGWLLPGFVDTHSASCRSFAAQAHAQKGGGRFNPSHAARRPEHLADLAVTVHAPQYINAGMALDKPLMEWASCGFRHSA